MIDADGSQVGILSIAKRSEWRKAADLDLVEVAPTATAAGVPHHRFRQVSLRAEEKTHDSKRSATASAVKEVKMGALTGKHDVDFKVAHIRRFVTEGQRVKLSISFRGRQITHPELGRALLDGIVEQVRDIAQPEGTTRMEGRNMSVLLTPR